MRYYKVTAGLGPEECCLAVANFYERLCQNESVELLSCITSRHGLKDVTLKAEDLSSYVGTIQYIFQSPIRKHHERKNWFIKCYEYMLNENLTIREEDLEWSSTKSSGAGGQHVNKTNSCVLLTYKPLNLIIRCDEERSQHQNKKLALERLKLKLQSMNDEKEQNLNWQNRNRSIDIERGNPVKVYKI